MVKWQKDFITIYKVTCTEPRFAEALERRFFGFVGDGKQYAARREAFEITREGSTCKIKLSNLNYAVDLASFFSKEIKNGTSIQTIGTAIAQETTLNEKDTIKNFEEEIRRNRSTIEGLEASYTAVEKRARYLTTTNEELTRTYQQAEETYRRETDQKLLDLETALANKDSFGKEIEEFRKIEESWKKVKECIGERELEEIITITREGSEAYLRAQIPKYDDIEKLGGREQILAEKGRTFEETEIHKEIKKAEGIIGYYNRLRKYFTEKGVIINKEAAEADLDLPEALLPRVFATTKEVVPKYEAIIREGEETRKQHKQKQELAQFLEKGEKEYQDIAKIPKEIEEILGTKKTITLELRLLGEDTENSIFEGSLPIEKTNAETELGRTVQLCMLATITDQENFPGLEYSETGDKTIKYRFKLPKTKPQTALQTTHTLSERMTALLGETDFGLAGGKLRILYTGIIGELPRFETEKRPLIEIEESTPKGEGIKLNKDSQTLTYKEFIRFQEDEASLLGIYLPTIEDLNLSQKKGNEEGTKVNHLGAREIILAMASTGKVRSKKIAPGVKERLERLYGFSIPEEKGSYKYSSRVNGWFASLSPDFIEKLDNFIQANPCFNVTEKIRKKNLRGYLEQERKLLYTFRSKIPLGLHTVRQAIEYEKIAEDRIFAGESFSPGTARSPLSVRAAQVTDHYVILDILKNNPRNRIELLRNIRSFLPIINEYYLRESLLRLREANMEDRLEKTIGVLHR